MASIDRAGLEQALAKSEAHIRIDPAAIEPQAERASLLVQLGRGDEARQRFLEVLHQDPGHFATLINFGALLCETDYRSAARTLFERAVELHPNQPLGHVNLANLLMYANESDRARRLYERALELDPGEASAHQRLSALLREAGELDAAARHRRLGFGAAPAESFPHLGSGRAIPLLVLTSTPAGDIAWRKLIDDQVFATTALAAEFAGDGPLPAHDLIFNAIGDEDLCRSDLEAAKSLCHRSGAPLINPPERVLRTGRLENARRLGRLPGVVAPRTAIMARPLLSSGGVAALEKAGLGFPILLRSPGFHTGKHFVRVERPEDLAQAVAGLPGDELMAIEPLDARGPDGFFRKHRVMMIGGALYPLHLAVSQHWKVHYFSGDMSEREDFRAEEAGFLDDMAKALGPTAMNALSAIQQALGLDYAGVDFALGPSGELLLFEANAVMNIIAPDAAVRWDYRRAAIAKALAATRTMLAHRARTAGAVSGAKGCRRP